MMKREVVTVPPGFLRNLNVNWDIDWRGQDAGEGLAGGTTVVHNAFPRWVGSPEVSLRGAAITTWRAIRAQAQGRLGIYIIDICDRLGFARGKLWPTGLPFSNDEFFSTGFGWSYDPFVVSVGAQAAGATQLRVDSSALGVAPTQGQIMSHDDWPFVVTWVTEVSPGVHDIGIQMPLRAPLPDGDPVLMRGRGRFEVFEEGAGNPAYGAAAMTNVRLIFREVLTR